MKSVENLFANFNDLSKPKTILDTPSNYTKNKEPDMLKTSLQQGSKFKKYQKKIMDKTKSLNNLETTDKSNSTYKYKSANTSKEGFDVLSNLDLSENGLTQQSRNIVNENDFTNRQSNIDKLRKEYDTTLAEYTTLMNKLTGTTNDFFDRVNPNNPYLNKTIRFTTGHICYVTNQGVVKYIPTIEIWNSVNVPKEWIQLNIPWQDSYSTSGTPIPTKPPLISGTYVQYGQSLGNEGTSVFVNQVVSNPQDKYIGCYNDKPETTEINFVPVMNNTNNVNGFQSWASSIYLNDNNFGSWAGFDRNSKTMWHSAVEAVHNYNGKTGEYTGTWGVGTTMKNGSQLTIMGEFLQILLPNYASGGQGIPLTKYDLQGRQGCCGTPSGRSPNSWYILGWDGGWNEIDRRENEALDQEMKTYTISNPRPWKSYLIIITNCGNPQNRDGNRYCVQIAQWNLYTSSTYSFTNADRAMIWNPSVIGYADFDTCKKYAAENGYKYFSQQAAKSDGTAACLVSNDLTRSQMYREAFLYSPIALWESKTTGRGGTMATITNVGTLSVVNSESAYIFSSDNSQAAPWNYLGCYNDRPQRAMGFISGGAQSFNYNTCQMSVINSGRNYTYFGLQNSANGENAQCAIGYDLNKITMYGKAGNCTKLSNGLWSGGAWSNAVYHTKDPGSWYFLVLQDDGNMCLYRGKDPNDNQGNIWCSNTNGKKQNPNPNFSAAKGKNGRNWMGLNETLAGGEFIGSNDGSIYLIMQTDGNLVLYTNGKKGACSVNKNGKTVGGGWVNALYEVTPSGTKSDGGKLAYINENSELREYASDKVEFNNNYTVTKDINAPGWDIPGAVYGGATIDQCKSTCNGKKDCYGFVFDNRNNNCWPKARGAYPYGGSTVPMPGVDNYVRERKPISKPFGISDIIKNIDTVLFRNYIKGSGKDQYHGLAKATEVEKKKVAALQGKLDTLSSRIAKLSNKFSSVSNSAQLQTTNNMEGLDDYLSELERNNNEIKNTNTGMTRIVNDSDIVVLQKNYSYLFWTILATGTVLVTMNMVKKQ